MHTLDILSTGCTYIFRGLDLRGSIVTYYCTDHARIVFPLCLTPSVVSPNRGDTVTHARAASVIKIELEAVRITFPMLTLLMIFIARI